MKYIPSINIEYGIDPDFQYILTPNSQAVTGSLVSNYNIGIHSFSIIGTYGTGKSCYLMALERDLESDTHSLIQNKTVFGDCDKFKFLNILGDYNSLSNLLSDKLNCVRSDDSKNVFNALSDYYLSLEKENKFLFIVIDEFGKILEHAAKNNPEKELYFLQRLAEFVNSPSRKIILITTLHQNFGAYAQRLTDTQRNEWIKVKGRYKELIFSEPVEQLLYLASEQLHSMKRPNNYINSSEIYALARKAKFVSEHLELRTIKQLFPLDAFSAMCITKAIQRYGQNERTLFSFLAATGKGTIRHFEPAESETYNLSYVYDYIVYNFFSALSEVNADSTNWSAMRVAIERVESGVFNASYIKNAIMIVKTIGLLNLFGSSSTSIDKHLLINYSKLALGINNSEKVLELLITHKIIRYASYKSSYILFEGTDIDIEDELFKAASVVPMPNVNISDIIPYINQKAVAVSEEYYRNGTPRYFGYVIKNEAEILVPQNDIDGYIQLIFPLSEDTLKETVALSRKCTSANIFVIFTNVEEIRKHLYEIQKLQYLLDNVILEDRVAKKEVLNHISYEKDFLNNSLNKALITDSGETTWIFNGESVSVSTYKKFNQLLTNVCRTVYSETPILRNELFNKEKLSSTISLARVKLLDAMLENSDKEDFGFAKETCPPEKAIYYTIFKSTGIHRKSNNGIFVLGEPQNDNIRGLWEASDRFIKSTIEKPRKISELIKVLKAHPIKLKQGVLDFWIPIIIYIRQQDFAIYNENGAYVMNVNKELFELLQKKPGDFTIKAFNVSGVKMEFFRKYREFLKKDDAAALTASSFIETFKPFLQFYRSLNDYARNTTKFEETSTAHFRDILGSAKDPEKAFFEDLPEALGFKNTELTCNEDFVEQYLSLIKNAVHELNICYDNLLERIRVRIVESLSLPQGYDEYKNILETRYVGVKKHLLTPKCKNFLERVLAPSDTQKEFLEKICNVILDKKLSQLKDKEEEYLIDNLIYLFHELERYISISKDESGKDEIFDFELASNTKNISRSQTYRLPENQAEKANLLLSKINSVMTGDDNFDICVLLKMLNEKLGK